MTKNQQQFYDYLKNSFDPNRFLLLICPKPSVMGEALNVGIQPRGKRIISLDVLVPKSEAGYAKAVRELKERAGAKLEGEVFPVEMSGR